jgi:hypothetical protein
LNRRHALEPGARSTSHSSQHFSNIFYRKMQLGFELRLKISSRFSQAPANSLYPLAKTFFPGRD